MVNPIKKIIKSLIGTDGYAFLLNTKLGSTLHHQLHSDSTTSRDFLLQLFPKFSIGAEIGVDDGNFSERILEIVRPQKLHLIDPWEFKNDDEYSSTPYGTDHVDNQKLMDKKYENVKKKLSSSIEKNQSVIHRGYSEQIYNTFDNDYLNWVYIDGNHLYAFVKKELNLCYSKVKPGGLITGDDYSEGGWSSGGVKRAVDEFINTGLVKLIQIKNKQFILQKLAKP